MKRVTFAIAVLLLLAVMANAQSPQYPSWSGGVAATNQVKKITAFCPTEGDYVPNFIGTVNDTSAVYVLPPFSECWVLTKPVPGVADQDSIDFIVYVQGKFTDELVTGYLTRFNGWRDLDSSMVTTPDTLGGDLKKVAIPPGVDQVRIIWDGITGNDALTQGTQASTWLILKY